MLCTLGATSRRLAGRPWPCFLALIQIFCKQGLRTSASPCCLLMKQMTQAKQSPKAPQDRWCRTASIGLTGSNYYAVLWPPVSRAGALCVVLTLTVLKATKPSNISLWVKSHFYKAVFANLLHTMLVSSAGRSSVCRLLFALLPGHLLKLS